MHIYPQDLPELSIDLPPQHLKSPNVFSSEPYINHAFLLDHPRRSRIQRSGYARAPSRRPSKTNTHPRPLALTVSATPIGPSAAIAASAAVVADGAAAARPSATVAARPSAAAAASAAAQAVRRRGSSLCVYGVLMNLFQNADALL